MLRPYATRAPLDHQPAPRDNFDLKHLDRTKPNVETQAA
jgi:hypothetical protein